MLIFEKLNSAEPTIRLVFRLIVLALLVAIWWESMDAAEEAGDARSYAIEAADQSRRAADGCRR
jgi:hypothetical protein